MNRQRGMSMESGKWSDAIEGWISSVFETEHVSVKQIVPENAHAELAFDVSWELHEYSPKVSVMSVAESARKVLGPLANIERCDTDAGSMTFTVMRMPPEALARLEEIVQSTKKALDLRLRWPLKTAALFFVAALLYFIVSSVLLHNHWYAYEEPWKGPVEFVLYHLPFTGLSHEHQ